MRFDATVEVVCDECGETEFWEPNFVYLSITGNGGHYDTSQSAFDKWLSTNGWTEEKDKKTYCSDCSQQRPQ